MKVSIVGSGVVGQATGVALAKLGNDVVFHDIRKEKLDPLRKLGFEVTTEIQHTTRNCEALLLCVPTPKDLEAFIGFIKARGLNAKMLNAAELTNLELIQKHCLKEEFQIAK